MTFASFHDFPGRENGLPKFQDFPGPVVTLNRKTGTLEDGKDVVQTGAVENRRQRREMDSSETAARRT